MITKKQEAWGGGQRVMVITGARAGIGRYLSEYYAKKGIRVVGCSRESSDFKHANYRHFCLDVSDDDAVCGMFRAVRKDLGSVHYLINNAAVASMNHHFTTPAKVVRKVLDTNVVGTYLMSREASKLMSRQKFGRIVNFTTNALRIKLTGESIYLASKAAIVGLTEVLAAELAEVGITVNALGPTAMKTNLIKNVPEDKIAKLLSRQPINRFAELEDISNIVDFFISDASSMVSGQLIYLGGV